MRRKTLLFAVAAGAALLLVGVAAAQSLGNPSAINPTPGAPTSPASADDNVSLSALDTDKNGSVSRMEAEANRNLYKQFPNLDKNANGALEPAEFARFEAEASTSTPGTGAGGASSTPERRESPGDRSQ
jgi:hypothetical protein